MLCFYKKKSTNDRQHTADQLFYASFVLVVFKYQKEWLECLKSGRAKRSSGRGPEKQEKEKCA